MIYLPGGYNVYSLLIEKYYDNKNSSVTLTIIDNGTEKNYTYTIKDLFNTSNATEQNNAFIFNTKHHYLL